jgi:hypothetical protein
MNKKTKTKPPVKLKKNLKSKPQPKLIKRINSPLFVKIYAVISVAILLLSTTYWSLLGAKIQQSNADQLVNPYLFKSANTLHNATLPGQHTFLIKWPLFLLIKLFNYSDSSYIVITILTVLFTVAVLAAILYKIERRPLIFGTLCLALSSVLLLVPAVPYAGGLLPINMAMITTRNLEYILYIASLVLIIKKPKLKSWQFWLGIVLMSLLVASDKLFLTISLGGAILALIAYALTKRWHVVELSVHWLIAAIGGAVGGIAILWGINKSGLTHISSQSGAGPYGLVGSLKDLIHGVIYAILGVLTNFGANPAFDSTTIRSIPHEILHNLISLGGLGFVVNLVLLVGAIYTSWLIIKKSLGYKSRAKINLDQSSFLAILLIWSTIATLGLFIGTSHDYVVDARYLTIALFALFISAAAFSSSKTKWQSNRVALAGLILLVSIVSGSIFSWQTYHSDMAALNPTNDRDKLIAAAISHHPVNVLVGDYWRVIPTKQDATKQLAVMPLSACDQTRQVLSSTSWQPNLKNHSFAYLISSDESLTDYQNCSLNQVFQKYGQPNSSVIIAGTYAAPKEELLFYNKDQLKSAPATTVAKLADTVDPISLSELPNTNCPVPTTMNIVAHEDDDLLFMNPDLTNDIHAGNCIRTIFITAGDAGEGSLYWLSRQQGSEAAYSNMLGDATDDWISRIVQIAPNEYVTIANPEKDTNISLIFMDLPDGGLKGTGFQQTNFQSLVKLITGKVNVMDTVDGQSSYTSSQLVSALESLMVAYNPTEINTQADYVGVQYPDHSDHIAVGAFVKLAYQKYETEQFGNQVTIPIKYYIGYPIREMPANVTGTALAAKEDTFLAYAKYDGGACQTLQICQSTPTYGAYLSREYQNPE